LSSSADAAPAWVDGRWFLISVQTHEINMWDLDVQNSAVDPTSKQILVQWNTSWYPRSVTPVYGPDGNAVSLLHGAGSIITLEFALHWKTTLSPSAPSVLLMTESRAGGWFEGLGLGAGLLYFNSSQTTYHIETAWLTSHAASPGSNLSVSIVAPYRPPKPSLSLLVASRKLLGQPLTISGIVGPFGLDSSLLLQLGIAPNFPQTGQAAVIVPVPNDPTLRGAVLASQALVLSGNGELYLTNTASLTVK
jgi:hypothetical protein